MRLSFLTNFSWNFENKAFAVSGCYLNIVGVFKLRYLLKINFHTSGASFQSVQKNMLNALNVSKNKPHRRYFAWIFASKYSWESHLILFFDSCFNDRPMLELLNGLNFKWNEFIKRMSYLLVVNKDLSKVVKTDQESSPDLCYLIRAHLFC